MPINKSTARVTPPSSIFPVPVYSKTAEMDNGRSRTGGDQPLVGRIAARIEPECGTGSPAPGLNVHIANRTPGSARRGGWRRVRVTACMVCRLSPRAR